MGSRRIAALRSVALDVPDLGRAEAFYTQVWKLSVVHRTAAALYLRGTGDDHHLLALHAGSALPAVREVTLRAHDASALGVIAEAAVRAGATVIGTAARDLAAAAAAGIGSAASNAAVHDDAMEDPAGGDALVLRDPHGRRFRIVHGDTRHADAAIEPDRPVRLTHVVLNSHDVTATQRFFEEVFDFRLADRTGILAFMNCNHDHHTLAIGITDNDALNHIAFLMPDLDSVMRGGGRLKDHGHPIQWGPGRHGPGNNLFNYFLDPFGVPIEYTAEVQQVDEHYQSHGPEFWKWPAGRSDHWGISAPGSDTLRQAQRQVRFRE